jgi:molecular chaperone DnaK
VPSVSGSFVSDRNLYSRQEGQIDFTKASRIIAEESDNTIERLEGIAAKIRDPKLEQARGKLQQASTENANADPERAKEALDRIQEAKMLIALARKEHLKEIREMELDRLEEFFSVHIRPIARPTDISIMENLLRTARRAITNNSADFEGHIDELRGKNFQILWRQEWFVIDRFKQLSDDAHLFLDETEHMALVEQGQAALQANDIEKLRGIVAQLMTIRIGSSGDDQLLASANILQG